MSSQPSSDIDGSVLRALKKVGYHQKLLSCKFCRLLPLEQFGSDVGVSFLFIGPFC